MIDEVKDTIVKHLQVEQILYKELHESQLTEDESAVPLDLREFLLIGQPRDSAQD